MSTRLLLSFGLISLLGGMAPSPSAAQAPPRASEDIRAAVRPTRQVQAALEPLPDTGITRDVGEIAVIEHDGSNYDNRLPDGSLNYEARDRVGEAFYRTHGDDYDFLVVFTNFPFKTSDATAFHLYGRNAVEGIHKPLSGPGPVFGSPARLKGWIDMADVAQYRQNPYSVTPGDLRFVRTLNVLAHEVGHQWLAEARYRVGGVDYDDLLGADDVHWSYLLDSDGSLMYGADWQPNGDGTFTAARVVEKYSALDLYLMGFLAPEKVPPFALLRNPAVDRHRINKEGEVVTTTGTTTVTVQQVIDSLGPRKPDWLHSQKEFRLGFVFLTAPGTEPSAEDLEAVERVRRAFGAQFFALTNGVAWADTTLAIVPPTPRIGAPDLDRALAWLAAQQGTDGSWSDSAETRVRDTASAIQALLRAGSAGPTAQRGLAWLQLTQPESLDFQARAGVALADSVLPASDRANRIARILNAQNPDGGFGAGRDFASDALDTALALRALRSLGQPADPHVDLAVAALAGLANGDGGWPAVSGGETSTVVTAEVLLALLDWSDVPGALSLRGPGLAALLARRNDDGGFGSSPSNPHASALALEVLARAGAPAEIVDALTAWLQQSQLADGSWAESPYQTALVLAALRQSLGANLVVPAGSLSISPNPAQEGETVHVAARVRNDGHATAPASVAHLYDGDPASSASVGEAQVPPLAPGEEAQVAFDYPTENRAGSRALYVVADATGQVAESREDDNTASLALTVVGPLADLEILPSDVAVAPAAPEVGESATVGVTVRNRGERASTECVLGLSVIDPAGLSVALPLAVLPALPAGGTATVQLAWVPSLAGVHTLRASADLRYSVPESDETNDTAERGVGVLASAPEGPDFAVRGAAAIPDTLTELPQQIEVRAVVENAGRTAASTTVAVRDGGWWGPTLGSLTVDLAPRSSLPVVVPVTVAWAGQRELYVIADPDQAIPEPDEYDNFATARLDDARTLDLELTTATLSSPEVEVGQTVTVTAEVRNRGTVDVPRVPVQLADAASGNELARTDIDLPAGQTTTVPLTWHTGAPGEIPLVARVDPFDLIRETREDNNAATLAVTVHPSGLPNLSVTGDQIALAPDPPVEGETASVSVLVRNTGVVAAGPFGVRFFVGDPDHGGAVIGESPVAGLGPESSTTASVEWSPVNARGSLGLFVVVDAAGEVEESDESDNRAFRPFQATGLPDLVLTAADVVLEPGYPRAGEEVTIRATVRNLGGQPSASTSLRAVEGEGSAGTVIGVLPVPELEPGAFATLSLAWTPASPPGERLLVLDVDPDGLVVEQDEGNNTARRTVVAQDADLYLTEPYFSPNGDGVKDVTTLAWRATGRVAVVVSNARGELVKTLVSDGPGSGSATWDGRDERGIVAWDGTYTITVTGDGGRVLGRGLVDLDTNRSPIHDANGPTETSIRNLTCSLPSSLSGLAWMPSEEEVLFVVDAPQPGFPVGLLRVGLDGSYSYVTQDDWYATAYFANEAAVSPDGREVLMRSWSEGLVAVDLATGGRRHLSDDSRAASWSPDGRFVLVGDSVFTRDGAVVSNLCDAGQCGADWVWSPASDRLARGARAAANYDTQGGGGGQVTIVARDGTVLDSIPLPYEGPEFQYSNPTAIVWRGDGKIVERHEFVIQDDRESDYAMFLIDPDARTARRLPFYSYDGTWSPDGSRYLDADGRLWLEDGTALGQLIPYSSRVSPGSSAASYTKGSYSGDDRPGSICGGKSQDTFSVSTLANLTAQLELARLPGNTGLLVRGTATDHNLERFQLDYASREDPTTWHPIGPAFDVPVVDDVFTVWVPPAPGTYVVRLSVQDRAGNARILTRVVSADRVPALANFTQSEYFVSPNADGVKDEVTFRYLVLDPTRLDVRIVGPEPAGPDAPAAREVRRLAFEYPVTGPESFSWNGTDDAGEVVPDGRYTVSLNGLPFHVEVDNTPPELGLAYVDPRLEKQAYDVEQLLSHCRNVQQPDDLSGSVEMATVAGDQSWHVVDRNLRSWVLRSPASEMGHGTNLVYVPETDASGTPIIDGGVPRVRREDGRPVDREDRMGDFLRLAEYPRYTLEAEDLAGNRSIVSASPPSEGLWMLGAEFENVSCTAFPVSPDDGADMDESHVAGLRPVNGALLVGTSLQTPAEEENVRFSFQPLKGGAWTDVPVYGRIHEGLRPLPIDSFESFGIDPTQSYRGRFVGDGLGGEIQSESFTFRPCDEWLKAESAEVPTPAGPMVAIALGARVEVPLTRARAHVWQERVDSASADDLGYFEMSPAPDSEGNQYFTLQLPDSSCQAPYKYVVEAEDSNGHWYGDRNFPKACQSLTGTQPGACQFSVKLVQQFPGCAGSPDDLHLRAYLLADAPVVLEVEAGPDGAVVAAPPVSISVARPNPYWPYRDFVLDAKAWPDSAVPARARLRRQSDGVVVAEDEIPAIIDKTPPQGEVLLPPDGGQVCVAESPTGRAVMDVLARGEDPSPQLGVRALAAQPGGAWQPLTRVCDEDDTACLHDPTHVLSGRTVTLSWDVTSLDSGDHDLQLAFCDRAGNRSVTPRRFSLRREPPGLWIQSVSRPVFSPNGDGRSEDTLVIARLAQAMNLSAVVRSGDAKGPIVRTLFASQPFGATDAAATWDGRTDAGSVAPDGPYVVVFQAADACGNSGQTSARVEVDTIPPEVQVTEPTGGQRVSASVDVLGRATDLHLADWTLDLNCGASPDWTPLASRTYPVEAGSFLATWDTSRAPPGECRLRLVAEDRAENRSPEAFATATVERGDLVESLSATPDIFSPNGDGRRETATVGYALLRAARVRLEVRDSDGQVSRTFETGQEREAGAWSYVWDGLDDAGRPAADGVHSVWLRAEDPAVATVYEEKTIRLDLDRTPPAVTISRPLPDAFVSPSASVRGSVTDRNLALFTVAVAPVGRPTVELVRSTQGTSGERDLAPLSSLAEGPHVLQVVASDAAENETRLDRPFQVDATPPRALIQSPVNGAFLRRGETPIPVTGLVSDDHLSSWTLRFGAGAEPAAFTTVAQGQEGGDGILLGSWDVRFVPDGVYAVSLVATDLAEQSTESRITVTLDSRPPTASVSAPVEGGYVTAPGPIVGTAEDANLASWELESAPGDAAQAYQWSPLGAGTTSVAGGTLAGWSPLPPDGVYTLRLTARDRVDLASSARVTVTVDTTPPAMPTGLKATVTRVRDGYGDVVVTWNANSEPDLAGYRVQRPQGEWGDDILASPSWDDGERVEGRYTFRVLAEDKAGNQSPPATLTVLVDLTPPLVSFSAPAADASVVGSVDVRGTAWSADDFAEYRLYVGEGETPAEWRLLRRSTVPVAAGTLGEWLALSDGPYVLALEADDTNGNHARVTRRVVVDTLPPEPPVLVAVAKQPAPADWLVPSWQPSPSADVIGTLVYRNGRLANATSVVLGDRRSFVVPGTSYQDEGLPDGQHCYRVAAMDAAGNESVTSNEICQSLDNRAPRAVIVNPPDGTRFGFPVHVVAETPDLDVASVRFERRASGTTDWVGFGEVRSAPPWETTLDPQPAGGDELAAGAYELRAVATDQTGNTDPDPARITVVYGDTTPPSAPTGLVAHVDGADVTLSWDASTEPDFDVWRVYRDGQRIADDLGEPHLDDRGLDPARYEYTVTAVDADGNESAPSAPAAAVVYEVRLDDPAWPVVATPLAAVSGDGSRLQTTVKVLRDGASIVEATGTGGAFRIEGVPLVPDGNVLQARGEDAAGNRSIPSNEVVLISNTPPAQATALAAAVQDHDVTLGWTDPPDADLFGFVVDRDGQRITGTIPQEQGWVSATENQQAAQRAFDGNPTTAWSPWDPGAQWQISFPATVLVRSIRLRFTTSDGLPLPAHYRVLAGWEGRWVPIVRATANAKEVAEHPLPAPFATDTLAVLLDDRSSLAEVSVAKLDAVPAGTGSFQDVSVPDGRHAYSVTAVDRYGAESASATAEAAVGDVDAPGRPTGLVATAIVRDVQLTWNANPEPDVTHYVVLRDATRIGTSPVPSYLDPGRPNGTYRYAVIAVDAVGNESAESEPADATIDVQPAPPAAPVILEPTDAAHPITLSQSRSDVAGHADPGSSVALEVDGQPRGTAPAAPAFLAGTQVTLGSGWAVALSPDGHWAAWDSYPDAVALQNLETGEVTRIPHGGAAGSERLVFSPDGASLALTRHLSAAPYWDGVVVLRIADASVQSLISGRPADYAWSPDGTRLAVCRYESGGSSLHVIEVSSGDDEVIDASSGVDSQLRWAPDGSLLAFLRSWSELVYELHVFDLDWETSDVLDDEPWPDTVPSWAPDGRRLAWTTASEGDLRVRVQDVTQEGQLVDVAEAGVDVVAGLFSPDGEWLSYVRLTPLDEYTAMRSIQAVHQRLGLRVTVREAEEAEGLPDDYEWLGGRLAIRENEQLTLYAQDPGRFVVRGVPLAPGENHLVARATDPTTGLVSPDSEPVVVTVPEYAFPDLVVTPESIASLPPLPVASQSAQLRLRIGNVGDEDAGETGVEVTVMGPGGDVVVDTTAVLPVVEAGDAVSLVVPWTPPSAGSYTVRVVVDPDGVVAESSETNNAAERAVLVVDEEDLAATIGSDRDSYPALSTAEVTVQVANAGQPFEGSARTTVEDAAGVEVAVLDERPLSLEWGKATSYALSWNTGATPAGAYFFRVRAAATGEPEPRAAAERAFAIESGLVVLARVRPQPVSVAEGAPAAFALSVENQGANTPVDGATARLQVRPEGSSGPATFETVRSLPSLLPGGTWDATDVWPAAAPAGRYTVSFEVESSGASLASATALLTVEPAAALIRGTLAMSPGQVLQGETAEGQITVTNVGTAAVADYPLAVEAVSGPEATVHLSVPATVDLGTGESRSLTVTVETGGLAAGPYTMLLRGGGSPASLDRATLIVHGVIAPPSPHAPADGARVETAHPDLVVNDAASPEGAPLTYEFGLFGDQALTQPLPGAQGVPGTPDRTSWRVAAALAEDATYWWRARATDGFSTSAWSAVVAFTVDALNRPPTAPVPDTPVPGGVVDTRQPALVVRNATDPEQQPLTYEFRLARAEDMADVVAAQAGVAEGLGLTSWTVPLVLDEDATYYWSGRASDGVNLSPWSDPASFRVHSVNGSPTAPVPIRPVGGVVVATHSPALVVQNASDPEGAPLTYRFEIDVRSTFDSGALQESGDLLEGSGETQWTPPVELTENAHYFWRAVASDGNTGTPSTIADFFVNALNEAPEAPVPLDPVDGRTVGTATPVLTLRNAVDPDGDALTYELEVRNANGDVVASVMGVPTGTDQTSWTVTPALAEDESFTWSARANDGQLNGPWSVPAAFRVDAVVEPPSPPVPLRPAEGALVEERRPALVVGNATSPDGLTLTYTFELEALAPDGAATLVERVTGIGEGQGETDWTASVDLADGQYQWRARASDPVQDGPWSATARFEVLVDAPPAAPTNLHATPGDGLVHLGWNASPEPDVTGYKVYRSTAGGGPYGFVIAVVQPSYDDLDVTNGVTYYYVVTALDARNESPYSNEAAARPEASGTLEIEVRYDPATIRAECLLDSEDDDEGHHPRDQGVGSLLRTIDGVAATGEASRSAADAPACKKQTCPEWLYATLELPAGHDPSTIEISSLRLLGSVSADAGYHALVDSDGDGVPELRVRFRFNRVAPLLAVGANTATIVGRAGGYELRGAGTILVTPLGPSLWITPRTLQRRSHGEDVQARLEFGNGIRARDVSVCSMRLNGVVPVDRVVELHDDRITVKFDRAAVIAVLPVGKSVEVRVTGTLRGLPFVGVDQIRVTE